MADERIVKVKLLNYTVEGEDPNDADKTITVYKIAVRGDVIDTEALTDEEFERIEEYLYTDDEIQAIAAGAEAARGGEAAPTTEITDEMTADEIAAMIEDQGLTAKQTVALARDDADLATLVLEAEEIASKGEPRKSVVEPLEKIESGA